MSDDELLEAVNNDLSREVPLALAPVSTITAARNKIAAIHGRGAGSKSHIRTVKEKTNDPQAFYCKPAFVRDRTGATAQGGGPDFNGASTGNLVPHRGGEVHGF